MTDPDLNTKELQEEVKKWIDFQNGLGILLTTPSVLVGYRVQVYRTEGTTQWYTAVIQSYNENTHVSCASWFIARVSEKLIIP